MNLGFNQLELQHLDYLREVLISKSLSSHIFGSIAQGDGLKANDIDLCVIINNESKNEILRYLKANLTEPEYIVEDFNCYGGGGPNKTRLTQRPIHISCLHLDDYDLDLPQIKTFRSKKTIPFS